MTDHPAGTRPDYDPTSDLGTPATLEDAIRERNGWVREAHMYCTNSDYWRERAEKAEAALQDAQQQRETARQLHFV